MGRWRCNQTQAQFPGSRRRSYVYVFPIVFFLSILENCRNRWHKRGITAVEVRLAPRPRLTLYNNNVLKSERVLLSGADLTAKGETKRLYSWKKFTVKRLEVEMTVLSVEMTCSLVSRLTERSAVVKVKMRPSTARRVLRRSAEQTVAISKIFPFS